MAHWKGPLVFLGRETVAGAEAYVRYVNDEGAGTNGRKLRLVSTDDSYDPAKTEACWEKLTAPKVFALGFFVGTPTAVKYVPLAPEPPDSACGIVHRSADALHTATALGHRPGI